MIMSFKSLDRSTVFNSSDSFNSVLIQEGSPIQDDSVVVKYNKTRGNGKKSFWRKEKAWVAKGDILRLFKGDDKNSITSPNSLFSSRPFYQSHKIDLDYYLDNFLEETKYKTENDWTKIQKIDIVPFSELNYSKIISGRFVYGFHPYWMGSAYYNYDFNIYNRLAYFGYVIDPETGGDLSTAIDIKAHSWVNSGIHEKASDFGCKIDLCIASYNVENNSRIFETEKGKKIREKLVVNILNLLKEKGNGVCFDIQKVPISMRTNYIQLIKDVSNGLGDGDYEITVVLPRYDIGFPYHMTSEDFNEMSPFVDRWVFTGDSFYGASVENDEFSESSIGGNWNFEAIDYEINRYPTELFDKLLLEVPLYNSRLVSNGADTLTYIKQYREIMQIYPDFSETIESSLKKKLEYANLIELQGIAVWASGYDHQTKLKNIISTYAQKKDLSVNVKVKEMLIDISLKNETKQDSLGLSFEGFTPNPELEGLDQPKSSMMGFWERLIPVKIEIHHVVVFCIVILLFFVIVGFIISLLYENAREFIFSREYLINLGVLVTILGLIILLKHFNLIDAAGLVFALGIGFGIFASWILFRKKIKKEAEETP